MNSNQEAASTVQPWKGDAPQSVEEKTGTSPNSQSMPSHTGYGDGNYNGFGV